MKKIVLLLIPIIVITVSAYSFHTNVSVSGIITNEKGMPVPSVTVGIAGTTSVAISDASGKYQLSNVPETAMLNFMGFGLRTVQEKVNSRTVINIVLYPAVVTAATVTNSSQKEDVAVPAKTKGLKAKINLLLSLGEELVRTASLIKTIRSEFNSPAKKITTITTVIRPDAKEEGDDNDGDEDELTKKHISN